MLTISRWKAAVMLFTVLLVSAMAIPNFLSEKTFQSLPRWAQHRVVPGIEYQGGTRLVLAVDDTLLRKERIERLRDDARRVLREAKVGQVQAPVIRDGGIQIRMREIDLQRGLAVLRDWFAPDVIIESDGNFVRLIVTEGAIRAEVQRRWQSTFDWMKRRSQELGIVHVSIERVGTDRIEIVMPGVTRLAQIEY